MSDGASVRSRRVGLVVGVVVTLAVAACASTDGSGGPSTTTGPSKIGADRPIRVPGGLGTHAVAASDDWVVGVLKDPDWIDMEKPDTSKEPSKVTAVDLQARKVKTFVGPVQGDSPIAVNALVADGDAFVGVGSRCGPGDAPEDCGSSNVLVRLDPSAGTWQTEDLPLDPPGSLDGLHAVDGDVVLADWTGESLRVTRLDAAGDAAPIATVSTGTRVATCVAGDDLWLFRKHSGAGVGYALWRVGLDDGAGDQIALPELADYFGGVTTSFGCDGTGPVITSTPPVDTAPVDTPPDEMQEDLTGVVVWKRVGDDWKRFEPASLAAGAVVTGIVSGEHAVLTGGRSGASGNKGFAVLLADGKVTDLPTGTFDTYLWRGTTGDLLLVSSHDGKRRIASVDPDD
jgi:hypothetical protein